MGADVLGNEHRVLERSEVAELGSVDQLGVRQGGDESGTEPSRVGTFLVVTRPRPSRRLDVLDVRRVHLGLRLERARFVLWAHASRTDPSGRSTNPSTT